MRAVLLTLLLLCTPAQALDAFKPVSGIADLESRFRDVVSQVDGVVFIRDQELPGTWHVVSASAPWHIICGSASNGIQVSIGAAGVTLAYGTFTEAQCRLYSVAIARLLRPL